MELESEGPLQWIGLLDWLYHTRLVKGYSFVIH